jgi:hypothetical protein
MDRMCLIYLAFDVAPKKVIWRQKVTRMGGPVDVPKMRNESAWKHLLGNCRGKPKVSEQLLHLVETIMNQTDKDLTNISSMVTYCSAPTVAVCGSSSSNK